ncbi:MAG: glycoside hydrolase family 2 TIM barrel-domain containing protein [Actinomycetota bacterium]|nr:glycoside hydrolase family 2 TIM barrel-domain containing protein [Actinomycetota bacterium]
MTRGDERTEIGALIDVLGRWWEDPAITGLRRVAAHTIATPASDDPHVLDLAGTWAFRLVDAPDAAPAGWTTDPVDGSGAGGADGWTTVAVPGCWTMQDVGDHPQYTNVVMPFAGDPPSVPAHNPTGLYRTTFEVPDAWRDRRTILHVGGAESAAAVWCNGAFVGIGTDSRLPSELELTPWLQQGENTLAVMVVRWAASTWVEDQDHWHHGGLHRRVHLVSVPTTSLADVRITARLADDLATGTLDVVARIDGPVDGHRVTTRLETLAGAGSPAGEVLVDTAAGAGVSMFDARTHLGAMADAYRHPGPIATTSVPVAGVRPWSHEDPHRYAVVVELHDAAGAIVDSRRITTGFRRVEIRGAELLLNGEPLLIAGVNRHDHHPTGGKTAPDDELWADVANVKRCGFNAVRTSHYPPDPVVLDACDELGLWVICEANVESHARWAELVGDPRFEELYIERVRRTVATHWNHPSIIGWSLGNEAGDGPAHDAAAAWVRRTDPSRFVQYEGAVMWRWRDGFDADWTSAATGTDIECPMYPPVAALEEWASATTPDRPLILCEYSHAMGNSNGGLADYWAAFERHHGLQGGFIWDWRDQGLVTTSGDGTTFYGYGGAFGDEPNDAAFCCNGMVGPDGEPHPAVEEHRWLTRPVRCRLTGDGTGLEVRNTRSYTGLDDLVAHVTIDVDGAVLAGFELPAVDVAPGATATIDLAGRIPLLPAGAEAHLTVRWSLREAPSWAAAGHVVAWDQMALPLPPASPAPAAGPAAAPTPATGPPAAIDVRVDPTTGLVSALTVAGRSLLAAAPTLAVWRAPTDNDGVPVGPLAGVAGATRRWLAWGLDRLARETVDVDEYADGATAHHRWTSPAGVVIEHTQRITTGSGVVRFDEEIVVPDDVDDLPRIGVRFALAAGLDRLRWYGRGPWETAVDRRAAPVGIWSSSVADQYVPYVTPQHHGTHVDTRWFELTDAEGTGVRIECHGLAFDASHHTDESLTAATTSAELRPVPEVHVHLDAALRGVGTGACGPDTTDIVSGGRHTFTWVVRPVG